MLTFITLRLFNLSILILVGLSPILFNYEFTFVEIKNFVLIKFSKIKETKNNLLMKITEYINHFFSAFYESKDAIMGSLLYSIYNHFYNNKPVGKNLASFFMGSIFSLYVAPVVYVVFDKAIAMNFISFVTGLLGMKIMEVILDTEWKLIFKAFLVKKLDIENQTKEDEKM